MQVEAPVDTCGAEGDNRDSCRDTNKSNRHTDHFRRETAATSVTRLYVPRKSADHMDQRGVSVYRTTRQAVSNDPRFVTNESLTVGVTANSLKKEYNSRKQDILESEKKKKEDLMSSMNNYFQREVERPR